jgi:hypothetical protein
MAKSLEPNFKDGFFALYTEKSKDTDLASMLRAVSIMIFRVAPVGLK